MNIKNLFGYNWYSRRKFLTSMAETPWKMHAGAFQQQGQRYLWPQCYQKREVRTRGASFDCVRDIFVHSLQAEQFWIRRLSGKNTEGIFDTPFSKFGDISTIQKYADEVEAETNEYLKTLTEEELQSVFEYKGWDGKTRLNKIEDILMHVIEEEIHHRGELLCIYFQNDIEPPYTNYTSYVDYIGQV